MGTWDTGHFDNDAAVDFSADLDEVTVEQRTEIVRAALLRAIGTGEGDGAAGPSDSGDGGDGGDGAGGPLDGDVGAAAVAAAALVAAQCPGGPPAESVYGPEEPLPRLPGELRALALLALDRVGVAGSEVRDRWVRADGEDGAWHHGIAELRRALTAATEGRAGAVQGVPRQ
ncbi:DUF4259 domain-containing protein [Streptomyces sp. L-9-10]|uniref:DUF4259 domain-containing protein n=1 Tax=Streptomyces sp. L-9-10 TaxID=1478131 RepID=UPI00101BF192|nr:DUF4259 domain-containing protein [Streptomyces sp. L-9-10]